MSKSKEKKSEGNFLVNASVKVNVFFIEFSGNKVTAVTSFSFFLIVFVC